jgi:hypothetical protein
MGVVSTRPTNGVSYGIRYTAIAGDASDGYVEFDFQQASYNLAYAVMVQGSDNVVKAPTGYTITVPSKGKVRVTGTIVAGDIISVIAQVNAYSMYA